jgi:elongator complex protein 4
VVVVAAIHNQQTVISPHYVRFNMMTLISISEIASQALSERAQPGTQQIETSTFQEDFCHAFDLTKKLSVPAGAQINFIPIPSSNQPECLFDPILENLSRHLASSQSPTIHRLVIPALLSPVLYPNEACHPSNVLRLLHGLRALLRRFSGKLTAMLTIPLELFPRHSGLVRWIELLSDGVIELTPFPHAMDSTSALASSGAATAQEEPPQGMLKIHRLPIYHEKGGGGGAQSGLGEDLAFTLSRRRFAIKPFSLPPLEGDTEAQAGHAEGSKNTKIDMSF